MSEQHQHSYHAYYQFLKNPNDSSKPTFDELKAYFVAAYNGEVPVPISPANLAKAYAHLKGANYQQTIIQLLARPDVTASFVPFFKEIIGKKTVPEAVAELKTELNNIGTPSIYREDAELEILNLRMLHNEQIERTFINAGKVLNTLNCKTKKDWGEHLEQKPKQQPLLQVTAQLSSEAFFDNKMHLAFLEVEPYIYGELSSDAKNDRFAGFNALKYLRRRMWLQHMLPLLENKPKKEEVQPQSEAPVAQHEPKTRVETEPKAEAPTAEPKTEPPVEEVAKKPTTAEAVQSIKAEFTQHEEPKVKKPSYALEKKDKVELTAKPVEPTTLENALSSAFGAPITLSNEQQEAIKTLASGIIHQEQTEAKKPSDFLHAKHPMVRREPVTLDTLDLRKIK